MKVPMTALALILASMTPSAPAMAQDTAAAEAPQKEMDLSKKGRKALAALQEAVQMKDVEKIPGLVAAAQKDVSTNDDKYVLAQLMLKAAADQNDKVAMEAAIDAMYASGSSSAEEVAPIYLNIGKIYYNDGDYASADRLLARTREIDPSNVEALVVKAESLGAQDKIADAVVTLSQAIAEQKAAGKQIDENWLKRAVAWAYEIENRAAVPLSRDWVRSYPTEKNWRDSLRIYQALSGYEDADLIDALRLQRIVGALNGESDYYRLIDQLLRKGLPGEALAVMREGFNSRQIDRARLDFAQKEKQAQEGAQGDYESLAAAATKAKAAAASNQAMGTGDAYYGYGDYANAADMYRTALTKTGVDSNQANLRLGMALARAGDKDGARAALGQVTGKYQDIAAFWLVYVDIQD